MGDQKISKCLKKLTAAETLSQWILIVDVSGESCSMAKTNN